MMTPERWAEVEAVYQEIADLPPDQRKARLDSIEDRVLREEVGSLLEAGPLTASLEDAISQAAALASAPQEKRFGPWRVTGTIGFGGMGAVYKAVRDDQAFDKQVALKVLRAGLETPFALERFRQERRILAGLEHPNIARLLDGGETESGLSYIAMEYIDGVDIVEYTRSLSRDAKLDLFLRICSAVQYAHQNLIVHRDLKPGNILVTQGGEPKLLDFGIAKLLEPSGLETVTGFQALTPQYASPEQILGETVTTASDIYSLGMVLYEILTGRRPYSVEGATVGQIGQIICQTEPAPPGLDGDLDNILLMALRKEPHRRYVSVSQFAADLSRYRKGLPVAARQDSLGYRAGKFVSRNRIPVTAAALVFASLVAGVVMATTEARNARAARAVAESLQRTAERERARAESEAAAARAAQAQSGQRLTQLVELSDRTLNDVHAAIERLPGSVDARRKIVDTTLQFLEDLSKDAGDDDQLRLVLADGYTKVADVLGYPFVSNLGDTKGAMENYSRALAMVEPLLRKEPERPEYLRQWAITSHQAASLRTSMGDPAGLREALRILPAVRKLPAICPKDPDCQLMPAVVYSHLTGVYRERDAERALQYSQLHRQAMEAALKALPANVQLRLELAIAYSREATALNRKGELRKATQLFERAIALRQDYLRQHPSDAPTRRNLMITYAALGGNLGGRSFPNLGDLSGARHYYGKALEIARDLAAADPQNHLAQYDLGVALYLYASLDPPAGEQPPALEMLEEAESVLKKVAAADPKRVATLRHLAGCQHSLGESLRASSRLDEALARYRESLKTAAQVLARDAGDLSIIGVLLKDEQAVAEILALQGDSEGALTAARQAIDRAAALTAAESEKERIAGLVADSYRSLATVQATLGNWGESREAAERSVERWRDLIVKGGRPFNPREVQLAEEALQEAIRHSR